jgi:hypothetical protein
MASPFSLDDEEFGNDDSGSPRLANNQSTWTQRRQAKRRSKVKSRRRRTNVAAQHGIHMRRNKRLGW